MGAVTIGLIAFFAFATSRLTTANLTLLYSDLSVDDSGEIVQRLEGLAVPYELRGDGTQIYVPSDQVLRLRMSMASEGLPSGGSVGYEIFDEGEGIGSTRYMNQLNHVRAIEGELSRTIGSLSRVRAARVHLVMPRRELFSRETAEPSASIVLKLRGAALGPSQVLAIQHLVATAVPQLSPSRISIVDDKGNLLAKGGGDEDGFTGGGAEEMRRQYELRLEREIEQLLERSVGVGKVRAEVAAEIDFDRITRQAERYDPEGQVVRSAVVEEEQADSSEAGGEANVSVAGNLPEDQAFTEPGGGGSQSASRSTLTRETTNYEITKVMETQVRETGVVRRLSVAVLIDGTADADGNYVERDAAEVEQLTALVRSAIGYEEARGDTVQVVNLQFAAVEADFGGDEPVSFFGFSKNDLFRIAEMVVLGIVAILVILLVVRPLISRAFDAIPAGGGVAGGGGQAMITGPDGTQVPAGPPGSDQRSLADALGAAADGQAAVEKVEGHVQASSLKQITEIVERHPEETVSILRGWMYQDT